MFLGHINDLNVNEWLVHDYIKDWSLSNLNGEYLLVSNICPHQGSYFLGEYGRNTRSCPYHGWSFKIDGTAIGSGTTRECKNTKSLTKRSVYEWNGFLFSEHVDLPYVGIDTRNLKLTERRTVKLDCDPLHMMDIFLDVDHIPIIHKGVYNQINIPSVENINWIFGKNTASQLVPLDNSPTEFYETITSEDKRAEIGAGWFAIYPGSMIEWQPGAWFITVVHSSKDETYVEVFKYRDIRYSEKNWNINEEVWETAFAQDCKQATRMKRNFSPIEVFEVQKKHFRSWLS